MTEAVTVVLTRQARPGRETEFEAVLHRLADAAGRQPGFDGVTILRPEPGGRTAYVVVVHFRSGPELSAWLDSPERAGLLAEADQYADAGLQVHRSNGLAGWFTLPGTRLVKAPPKVRMAIVTWIGILPLLLPLNLYLAPHLSAIPPVPRVVAAALLITLAMTYLIMPALTKLLQHWLWPGPGRSAAPVPAAPSHAR